MALTLDILSLVNNIKIIKFSKICWIGLEFFLVYIYLKYNIYIHTCDTFIPVKIIYFYTVIYFISIYLFCTWFLFKNIQYIMCITVRSLSYLLFTLVSKKHNDVRKIPFYVGRVPFKVFKCPKKLFKGLFV